MRSNGRLLASWIGTFCIITDRGTIASVIANLLPGWSRVSRFRLPKERFRSENMTLGKLSGGGLVDKRPERPA